MGAWLACLVSPIPHHHHHQWALISLLTGDDIPPDISLVSTSSYPLASSPSSDLPGILLPLLLTWFLVPLLSCFSHSVPLAPSPSSPSFQLWFILSLLTSHETLQDLVSHKILECSLPTSPCFDIQCPGSWALLLRPTWTKHTSSLCLHMYPVDQWTRAPSWCMEIQIIHPQWIQLLFSNTVWAG